MNRRLTGIVLLLLIAAVVHAQPSLRIADSIRRHYRIPELAYAVIKADTILDMAATGVKKKGSSAKANLQDRFHIGSNTKAITAFIAARLVAQQQISWHTTFFSLFPELKKERIDTSVDYALDDLLSFRAALPPYTYTVRSPLREQITGNEPQQRYALAQYLLRQKPVAPDEGFYLTNTGYILAGLMLEKASGRSYKTLVKELGDTLGIAFGFGYPNGTDTLQTWGHDAVGNPLAPFDHYKLDWLLSAGNINITLPDYARFIQEFLKPVPSLLSRAVTDQLLYGRPGFAYGWFTEKDSAGRYLVASNEGNAGAFITRVQVVKEQNIAFIIFTNAATAATAKGIDVLLTALKRTYEQP
ncbi:serine hydrolase domain-containing protein [Taibaiella chishuiensis]|uniref:CubicO group peptidase (Beta-lactamase class C family) n=1 Tax=Taibaiella chishuiensis TaxID=1434707 RepID=A0A2P8D485_9BACT|nr:serine hydrolase domain-containing protein [Taibaiella chishuiensis]PSK92027.1 CubicO group peptidase (beta-lactamase class C family) [Taibaiella chishuiensis]